MAKALKGPLLNPGSPQADFAPTLLEIVKTVVLQDDRYIARLQRHYALFRETIGPKRKGQLSRRQSKSRRSRLANAQKRQRRRQRSGG